MCKKLSFGLFIIVSLFFLFTACNYTKQNNSEKLTEDLKETPETFSADSFAFYEEILEDDSLNTELRLALAANYYVEKQFEKAIYHLLIVCRIDKKNIEALITLGNVYYDAGQDVDAIIYYEKALVMDNKNVDVLCDLATCYLNMNKPDKSYSLLMKNLKINPNHAQSHHNLSVVYTQLGKTKEAAEEMEIYNKLSR